MIRTERHGDVVRVARWNRRSRLAGFSVSAYLVRGMLVDTGFPGVGDDVERLLASERLQGILVSHFHEDHAGNIAAAARRGIPIAAHPDTLAYARAPERLAFYRRFAWGSAPPLTSPVTPFDPEGLEMIHTPGHSPEHQVVWDSSTGTLFSADLFIGVKVRVAHEYEEPRRLVDSLQRVVALAPARVFDAHRGLVADGLSALRAKLAWTEDLIGRVDAMARERIPPARIVREVLGPSDWTDHISRGEYSRANLVRAILREGA
ncbi:MAG: MBL fold metallo-hydrolase [Gemmatimonadetes bacterium]|nr:MBL fold metallo-hydrolase [Gemmatimonadota bacterium]